MLQNTFLHLPGIGKKSEQALWEKGIRSWGDLLLTESNILSARKKDQFKKAIEDSQEQYQNKNVAYFADHLPPNEY